MGRSELAMALPLGGVLMGAALGAPALAASAAGVEQDQSRVIEEIVVTSRRREESVQDVPVSVTAFGPEQIEQLQPNTLRDFDGLAPNVYLGMNTAGPGASALYIRGIGYADIEKTQSPQVGVIVDGIQMGSSTGQLVDTFDVESIEINRGPQGVLFGKNTIGGNIVVNRVRPQFNEFGIRVGGEVGNYDTLIGQARVNIPLVEDTLALKIGAIERERDGYYDNLTLGGSAGDIEFSSQTAALRWAPTDRIDAILTYDRVRDDSDTMPQDPRFNGDDPFENLANKKEPTQYDVDQFGLRLDWELTDALMLNTITGWHDSEDIVNQDFDGATTSGTAVPFAQLHTLRDQDYDVFSQEVRLTWTASEALDVMLGLYYFDSELEFQQRTNNILQLPPVGFGAPPGVPCAALGLRPNGAVGDLLCQVPNARSLQVAGEDVESLAYFGSVTFRPTPSIELMFGARYIDEDKEASNSYFDYTDGTFDDQQPGFSFENEFDFLDLPRTDGTAYQVEDSWSDTIITASASWSLSDANLLYVNYSEGFRSGGFSIRSARDPAEAAFNPEDAWQVEVGSKNQFFDNRLLANLSIFRLERDNAQFSSIIPLPPGAIPGTTTIINNGGKSVIDGVELETQYVISDRWSVLLNAGIIDVDNKPFSLPCEIIDGCVTAVPGVLDPEGTPRNFGDNSDSRQPDWNFAVRVAFEQPIGPGRLSANVGYRRVGEFLLVNTGGGADQRLFEGYYDNLDARVGYEWNLASGDIISVSAFGKNLTDEEWKEQALFLGGPNTGFQGWGAPRTYAVQFVYSH